MRLVLSAVVTVIIVAGCGPAAERGHSSSGPPAASASATPTTLHATDVDVRVCNMAGRLWGDLVPILQSAETGGGYGMSVGQSFLMGSGPSWMVQQRAQGQLGADVDSLFAAQQTIQGSFVDSPIAADMLTSFGHIKNDCVALAQDQPGWD